MRNTPVALRRLFRLLWPVVLLGMALTGLRAEAGPLKIQSMDFYYKQDAEVRYLELKTQWQGENRGEIPIDKANELAVAANRESDMETPFKQWRYHGGPAPLVFSAKAHVYSTGGQGLLNVPFTIAVRAKTGNLRVIGDLQLTDYQTLQSSARWLTVSRHTVNVPAIAVGEDLLLPLMDFQMLDFLRKHPNQFPVLIEVKLSSPLLGTVTRTLPLLPDHFVVPVLY